jgi:hypothetical protein
MIVTGAVVWGAEHPKQAAVVGAGLFLAWRWWQRNRLLKFLQTNEGWYPDRDKHAAQQVGGWEVRHDLIAGGQSVPGAVADLLPWYGIKTWRGAIEAEGLV